MPPFCVCSYRPGLGYLGNPDRDLNYMLYSDDEDDDDDFSFFPHNVRHSHVELHPRIRQLTDEVLLFHFVESERKCTLRYSLESETRCSLILCNVTHY